MRIKCLAHRARPIAIAGIAAAIALSISIARADADGTRATMRTIFENMQHLLRASADENGFSAPENADNIALSLREMSDQAALLSGHAGAEDAEVAFLGSALERYASWASWAYERGDLDRARALLHDTTDVCVACHTRLPSGDSPVAEQFIDSNTVKSFSLRQRASLQIATRRFDDALDSLETLLADESLRSEDLSIAISDYLVVSIRVKGDVDRPRSMLEKLSKRTDLTDALFNDINRWNKTLSQLEETRIRSSDLDVAKLLLAETLSGHQPTQRTALIEQVVASGILHRYLQSHRQPSADTAEAYFLLGLAEHRISNDHWLPKAELYLEKAILSAPKSRAAAEAYDLLEQKLSRVYAGASGVQFPAEVDTHLKELKSLITGDTY